MLLLFYFILIYSILINYIYYLIRVINKKKYK